MWFSAFLRSSPLRSKLKHVFHIPARRNSITLCACSKRYDACRRMASHVHAIKKRSAQRARRRYVGAERVESGCARLATTGIARVTSSLASHTLQSRLGGVARETRVTSRSALELAIFVLTLVRMRERVEEWCYSTCTCLAGQDY